MTRGEQLLPKLSAALSTLSGLRSQIGSIELPSAEIARLERRLARLEEKALELTAAVSLGKSSGGH